MNNSIFYFKETKNEPIFEYLKGSKERNLLEKELEKQSAQQIEIPLIIGGKEVRTGNIGKVVMPHKHAHVLATYHIAGEKEIQMAIDAAVEAHKVWANFDWTERAAVILKAAELISTKYRYVMSASTMLGQSKNVFQAEIDAVCEVVDFLRYNVEFAGKIYETQPKQGVNQINKMEYRALEGFVFAVSPFNFTAIGSNLNMSPVMMGNTTVWKPATTSILSNYYLMKIFEEAGLPAGVINFVPSKGSVIGKKVLASKHLAGIHFTGSNATFNQLWQQVGENIANYVSYPRLVGETGGKDFIFVHPTANATEVAVNTLKGAFEYQGQKCSAASRMYVPTSLWGDIKNQLIKLVGEIKMGDTRDFNNYVNAVIDESAFNFIADYIEFAKNAKDAKIIVGGKCDKSVGYFIEPTIIETTNPRFKTMEEEIFGPVLTVYVYEDSKLEETIELCDTTSPYALTGCVFARDRVAASVVCEKLKYAAGNFYINDKPSGAVVGMQPFGGARGSGTNDKAGGEFNLIRWTSPRTIKETLIPPTEYKYSYMD